MIDIAQIGRCKLVVLASVLARRLLRISSLISRAQARQPSSLSLAHWLQRRRASPAEEPNELDGKWALGIHRETEHLPIGRQAASKLGSSCKSTCIKLQLVRHCRELAHCCGLRSLASSIGVPLASWTDWPRARKPINLLELQAGRFQFACWPSVGL